MAEKDPEQPTDPGSGDTLVRTVEQLRQLALASPDASGFFPAMYAHVTAAVHDRCVAGEWADPAAMVTFTRTFAELYTTAAQDRRSAARCWRASWDVAADPDLLIAQHLLLGINAHVNFDLPQAVVTVADRTGDLAAIRPDFDAVNGLLAEAYQGVAQRLGRVARWTGALGSVGGGRLFNFSLERARDQAWAAAERLHGLDAPGRAAYVLELDELVSVLAYLVARPGWPLSMVLPVLRRCEVREPTRVTAALLRR